MILNKTTILQPNNYFHFHIILFIQYFQCSYPNNSISFCDLCGLFATIVFFFFFGKSESCTTKPIGLNSR